MIPFLKLLIVAAVTMGLSHTIAREKIFERLRTACGGFDTWLGYLISCPYCASHWIAFVLVPLTGTYAIHVAPRWPYVSPVLDWFPLQRERSDKSRSVHSPPRSACSGS